MDGSRPSTSRLSEAGHCAGAGMRLARVHLMRSSIEYVDFQNGVNT